MKAVLVLFEKLSNSQRRGLGHASLKLAEKLQADGALEQIICLGLDPEADVFGDRVHVLSRHRILRIAFYLVAKLGRIFPNLKTRLIHEFIFDRFAKNRLQCSPDTLLFLSRPLFNRTIDKAQGNGMKVWIQSSVPHPLLNFALVKNEEMRLGLATKGPYSDLVRAQNIARTILKADRLITLAPEIGRFTFDSYCDFVDHQRLLPLKKCFSIDPEEFAEIADARKQKGPEDEVVFFHISHINLIKGIPYLLEAWRNLQKRGARNCRLVLGGRMDHNVSQMIKNQFGDLANVEYVGFIPELANYLGKVDVFISPSISDAGPATLLEAMTSGLPVVASRNCGFSSLVTEGEQGFTYNFNDVPRLTEILGWFADHRTEIHRLSRVARKTMEYCSPEQYAEELAGHMESLGNAGSDYTV
jgi:glycosyltransferase involved in cell wall biosynthesis